MNASSIDGGVTGPLPSGPVLVIAPHPDDETLGCGATVLRLIELGVDVHWVIVTVSHEGLGVSVERISDREEEIAQVAAAFGFASVIKLGFKACELSGQNESELIGSISSVVRRLNPETIFVPYRNDAHSDHTRVFDAVAACVKTFRYPSIKMVCLYETLSETDFGMRPHDAGFRPNLFIDSTEYMDEKIRIMRLFKGEILEHPFPRSENGLRAQAMLRGAQSAKHSAEAFMIAKLIW